MKKNMVEKFNPSCINVINKSIMEWQNKFPPGFMCVGLKPHPFGSERHTTCFGITLILWRVQIVKGKDRPAQLGPKLHSELGCYVELMFCVYEPLFSMRKYVVMDSGFLLQIGLLHLWQREYMPVLSSRSAGIGQKVFQGISPTGIFQTRRWGMQTCWRLEHKTTSHSIYYS